MKTNQVMMDNSDMKDAALEAAFGEFIQFKRYQEQIGASMVNDGGLRRQQVSALVLVPSCSLFIPHYRPFSQST